MAREPSRRAFLAGGGLAAGSALVTGSRAVGGPGQPSPHDHAVTGDYPRDQAGTGGPVGSSTDRGKLVPGTRSASDPPVPVQSPDLPKLEYKEVDGFKEFHLRAQPVRRELLPGAVMNQRGFKCSCRRLCLHCLGSKIDAAKRAWSYSRGVPGLLS